MAILSGQPCGCLSEPDRAWKMPSSYPFLPSSAGLGKAFPVSRGLPGLGLWVWKAQKTEFVFSLGGFSQPPAEAPSPHCYFLEQNYLYFGQRHRRANFRLDNAWLLICLRPCCPHSPNHHGSLSSRRKREAEGLSHKTGKSLPHAFCSKQAVSWPPLTFSHTS